MLTALQFQVEAGDLRLDRDRAAHAARHPGRRGRSDRGTGPRLRLRQAPRALLPLELPEPKGNRALELEDRVRDLLADQGLQEAITYSLTSEEAEAKFNVETADHVALLNPISPERSVMRRTLLPACSRSRRRTSKSTDSVAMFELGFVYEPKTGEQAAGRAAPTRHRAVRPTHRRRVGRPARA